MVDHYDKSRRPKEDGSEGFIITYDSSQLSFKKSMVALVFTAMWLEAILHLTLVSKFGLESVKGINKKYKLYEDKLRHIDVLDLDVISNVVKFRLTRNELIHENSHLDKCDIMNAKDEVHLANKVMIDIGLALQNIS
jgi:hypothetical protein